MVLNEAMTREVLAVLDQYVRYYNEKKAEKVMALFSKDISGFGTGKDEVIGTFAQLKERIRIDLAPTNALHMSMTVLTTGGVMPTAWITGLCNFDGKYSGKSFHSEGRMTAVLVNRGGSWLFEQVHFSLPDA